MEDHQRETTVEEEEDPRKETTTETNSVTTDGVILHLITTIPTRIQIIRTEEALTTTRTMDVDLASR